MTEDEFIAFVTTSAGRLETTARALTGGDAAAAEDLVQGVLERSWEAWRHRTPEHPYAYARSALVRAHVSERRRPRWRFEAVGLASEPPEPPSSAGDGIGQVADRLLLEDALAELPRRQRQTVVLRYFEDLSVAEVADLLRCSTGSVKRNGHEGLKKLKAALRERYGDPGPPTTATNPAPAAQINDFSRPASSGLTTERRLVHEPVRLADLPDIFVKRDF